jgi:hypothetical protein
MDAETLNKVMKWVDDVCLDDSRDCKELVVSLKEEVVKYNERYGK